MHKKRVYFYQVTLIPEKRGGYTVLVAQLPGCVSYGTTIEGARANAREAIELHLENLAAHKLPIPQEPRLGRPKPELILADRYHL